MNIELPKDAEEREIPLDTTTLYTVDGTQCDVSHFTYYPKCKIAEQSWHIVFTSGLIKRASRMYLTPPDSWEKLEEDLGRAAERDAITSHCRYFNTTNRCANCPIHNDDGCCTHKDERAFGDILNRIRKLRGEDNAD